MVDRRLRRCVYISGDRVALEERYVCRLPQLFIRRNIKERRMMTEEIWKPVVGYEGTYQVSSLGRIRSMSRIVKCRGGHRTIREKILGCCLKSGGYYEAMINGKGGPAVLVHRIVALTFIPAVTGKTFVNHIDGIKTNNAVSNLEWVTSKENSQHAVRTGLMARGESIPWAVLTDALVLEIYAAVSNGSKSGVELAQEYNVSPSTISLIKKRKIWKHLFPCIHSTPLT